MIAFLVEQKLVLAERKTQSMPPVQWPAMASALLAWLTLVLQFHPLGTVLSPVWISSAASFPGVLGRERISLCSLSWQSSSAFEVGGHKDVFLGLCFSHKPLFCALLIHSPSCFMLCFFFHEIPLKNRGKSVNNRFLRIAYVFKFWLCLRLMLWWFLILRQKYFNYSYMMPAWHDWFVRFRFSAYKKLSCAVQGEN